MTEVRIIEFLISIKGLCNQLVRKMESKTQQETQRLFQNAVLDFIKIKLNEAMEDHKGCKRI